MTDNYTTSRAFFKEAPVAFILYDSELNFLDINQAGLNLFHFLNKKQVINKNITKIFPYIRESGRYDIFCEVIRTGKPKVLEDVLVHPSLGHLRLQIKLFKTVEGLGEIVSDITDLKDTIDELNTFIYKSSHDLRSPIASIRGLTNVAKLDTEDKESAINYFNMINEQAERLDSILQKLVETTRIKKGEKVVQLINFKKLIREVQQSLAFIDGFGEVALKESIVIKENFYSDKLLLISLFQNLIDNAIKFRQPLANNSFIEIIIRDWKKGVKITVRDNGIGINEKFHEDIFKIFFRATTHVNGTGLGLYTVKNCVKKLGGEISLHSEEKKGTTFVIYLPNGKTKPNK